MYFRSLRNSLLLFFIVFWHGFVIVAGHGGDISVSRLGHVDRACTKDDKKYLIKVYAHMDKGVIEAIKSAYVLKIQDHGTGREAVSSYMGTTIDSFNHYLKKFKIEIDLDLNSFNTDEVFITKGLDSSCEIMDPVTSRTSTAHEYLLKTYRDKVGVHLFLWSCPYRNESAGDKVVIGDPGECARSAGVMWDGTDATVDYIKSSLTEAISGAKNLFLEGDIPTEEDEDSFARVCQYADKCVISVPSANGVIIFGTDDFSNTIPASRIPFGHAESVHIPIQEGAGIPQESLFMDDASSSSDDDCKY